MLTVFMLLFLLQGVGPQTPTVAPSATATPAPVQVANNNELAKKLIGVKRIYVDSFGDDAISKQTQAMVIAALTENKRFVVTENKDKADAILRGVAVEKTSQEFHALNDKASAGHAAGRQSGSISGSFVNGTGGISGTSSGGFVASAVATDDSTASTETIDHARLAVRLVSADGDVIWATTQESNGAKYKGASADVAAKIVKQLMHDIEKGEGSSAPAATGK